METLLYDETMGPPIDLELAAREIAGRVVAWEESGIAVGPLTWREHGGGWPVSLTTNRLDILKPDSIGIRLQKGESEGTLVVFEGGWADLLYWSGSANDEVVIDAPDVADLVAVRRLLDRFTDLFNTSVM